MRRFLFFFLFVIVYSAYGQDRLRLATTTSTENSGLLEVLHAEFEGQYSITMEVIAVGTGHALRLGRDGDVDVLLVHALEAENLFMEEGHGIMRKPVMYNDFLLLGPPNDSAGLRQTKTVEEAMKRISQTNNSLFISRGDDSGTHKKELTLWNLAGVKDFQQTPWYLSVGQGMGATLQVANQKLAYILSDRGTYLALRRNLQIEPVFEKAPTLYNPYHVIIVNPARHPHVKLQSAKRYVDFLTGATGKRIIDGFKVQGERLFNFGELATP